MKPRFRIKELHLKNGNTIYVPQRRHWIFWVDFRDFFGDPERFTRLTSAQEYLREVERREKIEAEAESGSEVVGTSFIDYKDGN